MTAAVSEGVAEKLAVSIDNPSPKVGDILAAIVTPDDAVVTYSWTAGDTVVGTEEDLEVTADMLGKKIKVKVTALNSDTATSTETAAVEYEVPKILTAVRKAANSFTLNFDSDAQDIVKVDDIVVISEDKTDVKKITGLDFDKTTGESAVVTVSTPFKNGVTYNVYMKNDETNGSSFVASVGDVAKIEISTSQAEVNTPTKIEFYLFDGNGVDVTSAVNRDETCTVTFEGNYDNFNNKKASNTTVTMATSGDVCTVTVEYDKNDGKTDPKTASKDITCVDASAKNGTPYFKATPTDTNDTDLCYRFYDPKNSMDTNVKVAINKNVLVHFYAQDSSDESAISYDSYEIESADETVATAEIDQATGKWASFYVTGNTKGNVLLELKATKNGAESTYEIPVTVTEQAAPVKAKLNVTKDTMSNAWDNNYYGEITVTVTAADGEKADPDLYNTAAPVLKTTNKGVDTDLKGDAKYDGDPDTGFKVVGDAYTAWAAEGGNYVIEAEVTDLTSGKVLTARNTVTVKELPKEAWVRTHTPGTGIDLYAPKAFTDVLGDGIDDNTGLSYETWSTLGWITDEKFNALAGTSVPTGTVSNVGELALKDSVTATLATGAALVANGDATVGDDVYFLVDTTQPLTGQMRIADALDDTALLNAVVYAIENPGKAIYKKKVTTAPTLTDPAVISADANATVVDPFTLTTKKPNADGVAGQDAYAQVYSYWTGEGVKTSYTIEFSDSDKTLGYKSDTDYMNARLAATMNGLFAGYVHADGSIGVGNVVADNTTRIVNLAAIGYGINIQTYFGKNLVDSDTGITALYDVGQYGALNKNADIGLSTNELREYFITRDWTVPGLPAFYTAQKDQVTHDKVFAREGTYKVEFTYWKANSKKATTESAAFTVKNDLYVPGVVVKSQYLDSYDQEGWATAVVSEVDLNNNDSSTYSVIDLIDKDGATIADSKTPAKWAVVREEGVAFFKPLDRTFKLNS